MPGARSGSRSPTRDVCRSPGRSAAPDPAPPRPSRRRRPPEEREGGSRPPGAPHPPPTYPWGGWSRRRSRAAAGAWGTLAAGPWRCEPSSPAPWRRPWGRGTLRDHHQRPAARFLRQLSPRMRGGEGPRRGRGLARACARSEAQPCSPPLGSRLPVGALLLPPRGGARAAPAVTARRERRRRRRSPVGSGGRGGVRGRRPLVARSVAPPQSAALLRRGEAGRGAAAGPRVCGDVACASLSVGSPRLKVRLGRWGSATLVRCALWFIGSMLPVVTLWCLSCVSCRWS